LEFTLQRIFENTLKRELQVDGGHGAAYSSYGIEFLAVCKRLPSLLLFIATAYYPIITHGVEANASPLTEETLRP
jgi:hypothetical protein